MAGAKISEVAQSFLGFANFYCRFIAGFVSITQPLTKLLQGHCNTKKHSGKEGGKKKANQRSSVLVPAEWVWGPEELQALDSVMKTVASPPVLAYPDFERGVFALHTDAR